MIVYILMNSENVIESMLFHESSRDETLFHDNVSFFRSLLFALFAFSDIIVSFLTVQKIFTEKSIFFLHFSVTILSKSIFEKIT